MYKDITAGWQYLGTGRGAAVVYNARNDNGCWAPAFRSFAGLTTVNHASPHTYGPRWSWMRSRWPDGASGTQHDGLG